MPTYACQLPPDRFNAEQKEQIATAISQGHSEATGAPAFFVQVVVDETQANRYLGGRLTGGHVWVRGDIRAGRTERRTDTVNAQDNAGYSPHHRNHV